MKRLIPLMLILASLLIYGQTHNFDFINLDDHIFVTKNDTVQNGFTWKGVWKIFSRPDYFGMQLSFLSHMLDCHFFGLNAGHHHLTNVFFHILNSLLLFLLLRRMTGAPWRSGAVALMFTVHPINVESVAWIAERRNVLSTFFWFLALFYYAGYAKHKKILPYILVLLSFICGLLSKSMLVTLPFLLLLLDYWPLERLCFDDIRMSIKTLCPTVVVRALLIEKIPLFIISGLACVLTIISAQSGGGEKGIGGLVSLENLSADQRLLNALVSYCKYLAKTFMPVDLSPYYPFPPFIPVWQAIAAGTILLLITLFFMRQLKRRPWLLIGWFWYIGTMIPVIGFIQLGVYAMADRYAYVPVIGIFIILAWTAGELFSLYERFHKSLIASFLMGFACLMALAGIQTAHWENSSALFKHALKASGDNYISHNNLGLALLHEGRLDQAMHHLARAIEMNPYEIKARNNMGLALQAAGNTQEAIRHFQTVLQMKPDSADTYNYMGETLRLAGRPDEALKPYAAALRIRPESADVHNNIGLALKELGRIDEAVDHYNKSISLNPRFAIAHNNIGIVLKESGKTSEAITHYRKALELDPENATVHYNIAIALQDQGDIDQAIHHYEEAIRFNPESLEAYNALGLAEMRRGRLDEAVICFSKALQLNNQDTRIYNNLGLVFQSKGNYPEAIRHFTTAVSLEPNSIEAHNNLGGVLIKVGRKSEAIEHYEAALQINPEDADVHNNLGLALKTAGQLSQAVFHFRKALSIRTQKASDLQKLAEAHNNLGVALIDIKQLEEGIEQYQQAINQMPDYPEARSNLQKALTGLQQIESRISALEKGISTPPDEPEKLMQLGYLYYRKGRFQKAESLYRQTIRLRPNFIEALQALSVLYAETGREKESILLLHKIAAMQPSNAGTSYNLACMYARMGNPDESIVWLQKALENGYDNWQLLQFDTDLDRIRDTAAFRDILQKSPK